MQVWSRHAGQNCRRSPHGVVPTGTRVAAVPLAFTMLVAIATAHRSAFDVRAGGMEYALTLGVVLDALALLGPGKLTVSRFLARSPRQFAFPCAAGSADV